ncbi:MAG: hypothetical protein WBC44_03305, partial [Planctomycetaceae bacterium]
MIAVPFVLRRLLPCLLALCLASLGPAALAGLPRTVNANAEEETRTNAEITEGVLSSAVGVSRSGGGDRMKRSARRTASSAVRRVCTDPSAVSLRTLQVRIQ